MREPVLILSDLHLGHTASRISSAEQLRPLIEGMGTVVFNGDTFQELARDFRPRSEALLDDLRTLCAGLGVATVFLPGNHDPGWEGPGWIALAGGRIVVTHGDAVMWGGSPWSREALTRSDRIGELWSGNPEAALDPAARLVLARRIATALKPPRVPQGRSLIRRVLDAVNPPRRALEILRVWLSQGERSAAFARRYFPTAEAIVIGHFHHAGIWNDSGILVLNTGAYVHPHAARWIVYQDGFLRFGEVRSTDRGFVRGDALEVWRFSERS